ncbi:MAG: adenosylcobinamide-phosphate synthase CbiB [Litorilinea sp.]
MPFRTTSNQHRIVGLSLALLFDLLLGDPPNRYHPVAWMGSAIVTASRHAPRHGPWRQFAYGALLALVGVTAIAGLGYGVARIFSHLPKLWQWLFTATLLKMTFSVSGLATAAQAVADALARDDLNEARRLLAWHLVSRDTTTLSEAQVSAAVIESIAENTSDSIVAPALYYLLGGLPCALAYRFMNTADALIGYRDSKHEWLGKASARLDDLANVVPARLTAGLFIVAAQLAGEDAKRAWQIWRRDSGQTASPNAGHPMSAAAGALGVELEKIDHYRLGAGGRAPAPADIRRALRLMYMVAGLVVGLPIIWQLLTGRLPQRR